MKLFTTEGNPATVIVWSTFDAEDTVDHIAGVDVPDNDPGAARSQQIAEFVAHALNAYVKTAKGLREWVTSIQPLLPSKQ